MADSSIRNREDLPLLLEVKHLQKIVNVCKSEAYKITQQKGFPALRINRRSIRIPRDAFFRWLEDKASGYGEE